MNGITRLGLLIFGVLYLQTGGREMFKSLGHFAIGVVFGLIFVNIFVIKEPVIQKYEQNQMVDGCVMQKTADVWIKTCG